MICAELPGDGLQCGRELAAADGDHEAAFRRYQQLLRPYVARGQKQARGGKDFLAPPTPKKIAQLHRFYRCCRTCRSST